MTIVSSQMQRRIAILQRRGEKRRRKEEQCKKARKRGERYDGGVMRWLIGEEQRIDARA